MIQTYAMVFWAKPHKLSLEEMTEISYRILGELDTYGDELSPKYLTAKKKSDVKEFRLSKGNVKHLLEKSVNKEGETIFMSLGRQISFFSSLKEELSCGIRLTIGVSSPVRNNALVINLPYENFSGLEVRRADLEGLFKRIASIFNPYFAFISNSRNKQLSTDGFWKDDKPTYVHWMNYYDESAAECIGTDRLLELDGCELFGGGYYYKLQDVPINVYNFEHLERQRQVSMQLGLI